METTRVLIIDDDRDTADLFKTVLDLVGFECEAAYSARTALSYLSTNEPDIILLDMRLGMELDGGDILYQIRSNPRFDKVRVIVITGYPGMLDRVNNLADLSMLKPVSVSDLRALTARISQTQPKSYLFRDPLTNLYTVKFFLTRLEHAHERARRNPNLHFAVLAVQFNAVTPDGETLQAEAVEKLLAQIGECINKDFRRTDTFGFLGGLRVIALYEDLKQPEDIEIVVRRLRDIFAKEFETGGGPLGLSLSIGAVLNHPRFKNEEEIMDAAVTALEQACQSGPDGFVLAHPYQD